MVKGWVEHREGARFESQWGQRMEDKKITYQKKKKEIAMQQCMWVFLD